MEVSSAERTVWVCAVLETMAVETLLAAAKSLASLLFVTGSLLNEINVLPHLTPMNESFPLDELHGTKRPDAENKDASDTEDDDEEDEDDNADDQDDDAGDEDFSAEGEEEADPEDDPEANGEGGSDDEDDDDGDDDGDEDGEEDEDEEEEEEEEEEVPQPPTKKRK